MSGPNGRLISGTVAGVEGRDGRVQGVDELDSAGSDVEGWNGEAPLTLPAGDLWVFGYGSVMWRPGFAYEERQRAQLHGFRRALCVWSWWHRGSPDSPGLVLGLDRGGSCIGQAYRIAAGEAQAVAEYLYAREMVTPVYVPHLRTVRLAQGSVTALTFLVDREHPQYAGRLTPQQAANVVRHARGQSGANPDYLASTVEHLRDIGLKDAWLEATHALVAE